MPSSRFRVRLRAHPLLSTTQDTTCRWLPTPLQVCPATIPMALVSWPDHINKRSHLLRAPNRLHTRLTQPIKVSWLEEYLCKQRTRAIHKHHSTCTTQSLTEYMDNSLTDTRHTACKVKGYMIEGRTYLLLNWGIISRTTASQAIAGVQAEHRTTLLRWDQCSLHLFHEVQVRDFHTLNN
jgi:hypothetical protein